jgi:DNA-binding MarR family transcriptional regulator
MRLERFFPYRLAVLAEAVSRSMAQVYAQRFELTRDEWRVLSALAETRSMKTGELIAHTTLDKMPVSRAVNRLERDGLIAREDDPDDRRGYVLRLRPAGRALYRRIVPVVLERERYLFEGLSAAEQAALESAMDKLLLRARDLLHQAP